MLSVGRCIFGCFVFTEWIRPMKRPSHTRLSGLSSSGQRRPVYKRPHRAYRVDTADEAAEPHEVVRIVELGPATAAARIDREAETFMVMQGLAVCVVERRHDRDLVSSEFQRKGMFLAYRLVAPAAGAIEFRDDVAAFLHADLIHAVFVTVERMKVAVAMQPGALNR